MSGSLSLHCVTAMATGHCCVPMCVNDSRKSSEISFHTFPKDKTRRQEWVDKIRRDPGDNFKITKKTVVCSAHFKPEDVKKTLTGMRNLRPGAVPSVFSWTPMKKPRRMLQRRAIFKSTPPGPVPDPEASSEFVADSLAKLAEHDYVAEAPPIENQLEAAQKRIEELEAMVDKQRRPERHFLERYSNNPDKIKFYTGFPSYSLLISFFQFILPHTVNMISWNQVKRNSRGEAASMRAGFQCTLPMIDQYFLFLNKIKLGSFDIDLADKFGISASTVSRIVTTWANFLYTVLGSIPLWPTRELVDRNMPVIFNQFPKTRVILDCTELFVQAPSSLNLNSELYSHYKGHDTFKCLIGISPGGLVTFVSSLYAGGISDKEITKRSGVLDLLEPGDQVMVDKGFTIQDLLEPLGCSLVIPPFLTANRSQFTKEETEQTQTIARLRVHVERAIRRVKEYHLFDGTLPMSLAGSVNQLWTVCCILTNFQGPLF